MTREEIQKVIAKGFLERAVAQRDAAEEEASTWKAIAEKRVSRSAAYSIGFCSFLLGNCFSVLAEWVTR